MSQKNKLLLFDPDVFRGANERDRRQVIEKIGILIEKPANEIDYEFLNADLGFEDWDLKRCIKAILPENLKFGGYSQAGHIIQVNLREELLPYRYAIGEILISKINSARTVVNKLDKITNEFRVLDTELLAGEPSYTTETIERGIRYKLDYSKVFWNGRLNTVHERIVNKFNTNSVVFDVFAGIGPFILPAVKIRKVRKAYANDLNPIAIQYLTENIALNNIKCERIETFNMDGAEFIEKVIPLVFMNSCKEASDNLHSIDSLSSSINFHCVMNLPGYSIQFLPYFKGLFHNPELRKFSSCKFWMHCHFFVKAEGDEPSEWFISSAEGAIKEQISLDLEIHELKSMRKVAGRKEMFCATFLLPPSFLYGYEESSVNEKEKPAKIPKFS